MSSVRNILMFLFLILFLTTCRQPPQGPIGWFDINSATDEPPGVGVKADLGYAACKPIIEALEAYKEAHGGYPPALEALVPELIAALPGKLDSGEIWYEKTDAGYRLYFTYTGPGMNICTFSPEAGQEWKCSGAY